MKYLDFDYLRSFFSIYFVEFSVGPILKEC